MAAPLLTRRVYTVMAWHRIGVSLLLLVLCVCVGTGEGKSPRGASPDSAHRYVTGQPLTCGGGDEGKTVPYKHINDDYCDCPDDGADEPGTSACPNASFYCVNKGYKPSSIPSSRVNDRICDCCDGSDEYEDLADCPNTCHDIGRAYRQELLQKVEDSNTGYNIRQQYIEDNKNIFSDKQDELDTITQQLEMLEELQKQLEAEKESKETLEKEALEEHQLLWEEKRKSEEEDWMLDQAQAAFAELDNDRNGIITYTELEEHTEFDIDYSGDVGEDEASWVLSDDLQADIQEFVQSVWSRIHGSYRWEKNSTLTVVDTTTTTTTTTTTDEPAYYDAITDTDDVDDMEFDDDEDYVDDEELEIGGGEHTDSNSPPIHKQPYDEHTQILVDAAQAARNVLKDHEKKMRDLKSEKRKLEKVVGIDFGVDNVFHAINEECYEYHDREYVYKLCTFNKVTQKPHKGGSETNLGNWEGWLFSEDADNSYVDMKYSKGQKCWNGPDRSTVVHLSCGSENTLTGVSEPNKCEYRLELTTPAACSKQLQLTEDLHIHYHDEL